MNHIQCENSRKRNQQDGHHTMQNQQEKDPMWREQQTILKQQKKDFAT